MKEAIVTKLKDLEDEVFIIRHSDNSELIITGTEAQEMLSSTSWSANIVSMLQRFIFERFSGDTKNLVVADSTPYMPQFNTMTEKVSPSLVDTYS